MMEITAVEIRDSFGENLPLLGLSILLTLIGHGLSAGGLALGEWARAKRAEIRGAM